jgi:hypothetical protein
MTYLLMHCGCIAMTSSMYARRYDAGRFESALLMCSVFHEISVPGVTLLLWLARFLLDLLYGLFVIDQSLWTSLHESWKHLSTSSQT